mmetsp:Transcript_90149/g.165479  ORF Transcript_90149/g.165479 Transcript_90149/m.165479 type:complete len:699 (+) Transcript_90149:68-2164(+)
MKITVLLLAGALSVVALDDQASPIGKVVSLLDGMAAKVKEEGAAEAKVFKEHSEFCATKALDLENEIKTGIASKEKLEAKIADLTSTAEVAESKVGELAGAIASTEAELKEATTVREKEAATYMASEKELIETVDALDRASSVLSREMGKNPAALAQIDTKNMENLLQTFSVVVDAASLSSSDKTKLLALVQSQEDESDGDEDESSAPAAAAYKSHSSSIVDMILDLKEKAEDELSKARKAEMSAKQSYKLLKQSLTNEIAVANKEMAEEKATKASALEDKASFEGELTVTVKDVAAAKTSLEELKSDCAAKAADHEISVAETAEELKVIAEATKILQESTSGALVQSYSLLQVRSQSKMHSRVALVSTQVVNMVKKLAHQQHSAALMQLASRISAVLRYGSRNGEDPFAKVKTLISDLIEKLQKEAGEEAEEKAFCDAEMKKTSQKKEELEDEVEDLSVDIDKATSRSAALKEDVKELQAELRKLLSSGAEMAKIRAAEHADYEKAKSELTQGLEGVRQALSVLRDYYGGGAALLQSDAQFSAFMNQPKASGAAGGIIDLLEVCESDFAKSLAEKETEEADAASAFEKETQDMKVAQASKEDDVKYKTSEFTSLDKKLTELSSDKDSTETEFAAVNEYDAKIKERCVSKPEPYAERKARREAEISGLKEALTILEDESFLQRGRRSMRGSRAAGRLQ